MRYLHESRQRFLRLLVILRWLSKSHQAHNVSVRVCVCVCLCGKSHGVTACSLCQLTFWLAHMHALTHTTCPCLEQKAVQDTHMKHMILLETAEGLHQHVEGMKMAT